MKHVPLSVLLLVVAALAFSIPLCQPRPLFVNQTSPAGFPSPGQTITLQVGLDQTVSGSQVVNIATSNSSQFSSIPSTVTVTNGNSTVSFQATLSPYAAGEVSVQASCNGEVAVADISIAENP